MYFGTECVGPGQSLDSERNAINLLPDAVAIVQL